MAYNYFPNIMIYTGGSEKEKKIAKNIINKYLINSKSYVLDNIKILNENKICKLLPGYLDIDNIQRKYNISKIEGSRFNVKITGDSGEIFKDFWIKNIFPRKRLYQTGLSNQELDYLIKTRFLHKLPLLKSPQRQKVI